MEEWINLGEQGFPGYAVSNQGRIRNEDTERILRTTVNQQGICKIGLFEPGSRVQYVRSVTLLVANAFLPYSGYPFDTPINLNGDRTDNRSCNLAWRPRWFAMKYHRQFERPPYRFKHKLRLLASGEIFNDAREASTAYGMLEEDIVHDLENMRGSWPFGFKFEEVK